MPASPAVNSRSDKSKTKSKVVILKLSPSLLKQFAPKQESTLSSSAGSPLNHNEEASIIKPTLSIDAASDSNSTPAPGQDASIPSDGNKKRKAPSAPRKSLNPPGIDTMPKPRGKPGPKKKPRLDDGTIDHSNKPAAPGAPAHKLGPKANTGAINAGLRALDRTGTPCRKWAKRGFQLKSFTGIVWEVHSWKGGENSALSRDKDTDSSSEMKDVSMQSSSDVKPNGSDVAMSNVGDQPDAIAMSTPAASSPAPMTVSAAIAAHG